MRGVILHRGIFLWLLLAIPVLSWATGIPEGTGQAVAAPGKDRAVASAERAAVIKALGTSDVQGFLSGMDADRLLLVEIRKDLPQQRGEADAYLKRLKELSAQSDPARLVPKVNRLMEQAPIYYNWVEKDIANQSENSNEYLVSGARGFVVAFQDFQNTLLLTVINRLEIAAHAIQVAVPDSPI